MVGVDCGLCEGGGMSVRFVAGSGWGGGLLGETEWVDSNGKGVGRTSDSPADQRRSMSVKVGRGEAKDFRAVEKSKATVIRTRMVAVVPLGQDCVVR